VYSWAHLSA